jgi:hypothetical protein
MLTRLPKTQANTSFEARALADLLLQAREGDLLLYTDLEAAVGRDLRKQRYLLATARRIALREGQCVFRAVTRQGLRRLCNHELPAIGEARRQHIRRTGSRAMAELECARFGTLLPQEATKVLAYISVMGAIAALSHATTVSQVTRVIANAEMPRRLDATGVIDVFATTCTGHRKGAYGA